MPDWMALTLFGLLILLFVVGSVVQLVGFLRLGDQFLGWMRGRRRRDRE